MKKFRFITTVAAAFAVAIGISAAASAAIFRVAENGDDQNDGDSWLAPFATVTKALEAAADSEDPLNQIWVRQGTYYPTNNPADRSASFTITDAHNNVQIYGGFPANHLSPGLDDRDPTLYPTILSGDIDGDDNLDADNAYTVVTFDATSGTISPATLLDGFTITGGNNTQSGADGRGGGIRIIGSGGTTTDQSDPRIRNCIIAWNDANDIGGGIYIAEGSPIISRSTIECNSAEDGAAIAVTQGGTPTFVSYIFRHNTATGDGGAILAAFDSCVELHNALIDSNAAAEGAGLPVAGTQHVPLGGGS